MHWLRLIILATASCLAGCSGGSEEPPADERGKAEIEQAMEARKQPLEKARAVEEQLKEAAENSARRSRSRAGESADAAPHMPHRIKEIGSTEVGGRSNRHLTG